MSETKRNLEDMENGEAWGMYTTFYSTNIEPKLREKTEKKEKTEMGRGKANRPNHPGTPLTTNTQALA